MSGPTARGLLEQLRQEMRLPEAERATGATTPELEQAAQAVSSWDERRDASGLESTARMVVDRWSLTSELGAAVLGLAQGVRRSRGRPR